MLDFKLSYENIYSFIHIFVHMIWLFLPDYQNEGNRTLRNALYETERQTLPVCHKPRSEDEAPIFCPAEEPTVASTTPCIYMDHNNL